MFSWIEVAAVKSKILAHQLNVSEKVVMLICKDLTLNSFYVDMSQNIIKCRTPKQKSLDSSTHVLRDFIGMGTLTGNEHHFVITLFFCAGADVHHPAGGVLLLHHTAGAVVVVQHDAVQRHGRVVAKGLHGEAGLILYPESQTNRLNRNLSIFFLFFLQFYSP